MSTTRTRLVLMAVLGIAAGLASCALLRFILTVPYAALMRTNTGPSDWAIAPVVAAILALVMFPYGGAARILRDRAACALAAVVAAAGALTCAVIVRANEPAIAASHVTVVAMLSAFSVAVMLKAMWATLTFRVPTRDELVAGLGSAAVEVAVSAAFSAAGAATGGGDSGETFASGGGSFGGGGATGSWQ